MCSPRQLPLVTFYSQPDRSSQGRRHYTQCTGDATRPTAVAVVSEGNSEKPRSAPRSDGSFTSGAWLYERAGRACCRMKARPADGGLPGRLGSGRYFKTPRRGARADGAFRWRARADRAPAFARVLDMSAHKYTALCRVCERLQAGKKARSPVYNLVALGRPPPPPPVRRRPSSSCPSFRRARVRP